MPVTVKVNFPPVADFPISTSEIMRQVGLLARERILLRTAAGVDEHDRAFASYSPGYAKVKSKELGTARVNLQVSGGMLNAITITRVTESSVELGFR